MKISISYFAKLPQLIGTSEIVFKSEKELTDYINNITEKLSEISQDEISVLYLTESEFKSENLSEIKSYSIIGKIKFENKNQYKYVLLYRTIYFYYYGNKICDNYSEIEDNKEYKINKAELYANLGIKKTKINKDIPYFKKITKEKAENLFPNVFYEIEYPGHYFVIIESKIKKEE